MSTTYKCITIAYFKFSHEGGLRLSPRAATRHDTTRRDRRSRRLMPIHTFSLTLGHLRRMLDRKAISQTEIKVLTIWIIEETFSRCRRDESSEKHLYNLQLGKNLEPLALVELSLRLLTRHCEAMLCSWNRNNVAFFGVLLFYNI